MNSSLIRLLTLALIIGSGTKIGSAAVTNTPPGGNLEAAQQAPAVPPQEVVAELPSLVKSNSPAGIDFGVGASSFVREEIRLLADGAVADYGLQKVFFPAEITEAPIRIITADGRNLAFRATFLAVRNTANGQSIRLGEVTNSIGALIGDNTIVYQNAFDNGADIRFRYSQYSLEQDILLHTSFKLPDGIPAESAQLEVWSEWIDSSPDAKESQVIDLRPLAATGAQAGLAASDGHLKFGASHIGDGFAFGMQNEGEKTPVAKTFTRIEGRDWLIERADYIALKPLLDKLPKSQASFSPESLKSDRDQLIRSLQARTVSKRSGAIMRLAKAEAADKNTVVLDFVIVSSVPVPAGVVSWWPAGGNANDAILAGGNNGTLYNSATYGAGKVGQAFSFNGATAHVRIPDQANLHFTNALTIEAWVNPNNVSGNYQIVDKWDAVVGYNQRSYSLMLFSGGQCCLICSPGGLDAGSTYVLSSNTMPTNTWTHVAGTYDGATLKMYRNGVLDGSGVYTNGIFPGTNAMGIGGVVGGGAPGAGPVVDPFPGLIDEPAIYSRALGDWEIQAIYNAGVAGKNNPNCVTAPTNIVAWWPGDGNIYDLARTNFATLSGATYESAAVSQGFSFDGTNDGVTAADDNALNLATTNDNVTIEVWVKPLTNVNDYGVMSVVGKRYSSDVFIATGYELFMINGVPGFQIANGTSIYNFNTTNHLRDGSFHHVVVTMDRSNTSTNGGYIYIDGVPKLEFNPRVLTASLSNSAPVRIGMPPQPGFNGWYKGIIDEVTIYRRALTNTEVTALYTAGSAAKCKMDTDGDGLTDLQEAFLGTNPNSYDSDGDGWNDWQEIQNGTDPNTVDQPLRILITQPKSSANLP